MLSGMSDIVSENIAEQLIIVDSLVEHSDVTSDAWALVRKEVERHGLEGASVTARQQIAVAMLKARQMISKGDYVGHPFRGNQWSDSSGATTGGAGGPISQFATAMHTQVLGTTSAQRKEGMDESQRMRAVADAKRKLANRPEAIKVSSIKEALRLIKEGKVIELDDERKVNTLLEKLNKEAKKGDTTINLCNVTVSGTSLFCADSLKDDDGQPLERIKMPQLSGDTVPGSEASKVANDKGEADAGPAFLKFLKTNGVSSKALSMEASTLKASQSELIGAKVASIMDKGKGKMSRGPIYVSRDNYVIDGHHRWAAAVGLDTADGMGDFKIDVVKIDMPISEVLQVARDFTDGFGIARQKA